MRRDMSSTDHSRAFIPGGCKCKVVFVGPSTTSEALREIESNAPLPAQSNVIHVDIKDDRLSILRRCYIGRLADGGKSERGSSASLNLSDSVLGRAMNDCR